MKKHGNMAQCVKDFTHMHEDLSQISSTHVKSQTCSVNLYCSAGRVKIREFQQLTGPLLEPEGEPQVQ